MAGPKACGCSIFSGGFTTGLLEAGFDVVGQWEEVLAGAKTFELNFPQIEHPLEKKDWPVEKWHNDLELFYANPPCAPWSPTGSHLGVDDPRMQMTANAMETGLLIEPEFFILESVPRAWSETGGRDYYTGWARKWLDKGYGVTVLLTNALLHGAPQCRERFHFIAHKMKLALREPHPEPHTIKTVRDAIFDLKDKLGSDPNHVATPVREKSATVIADLAEGESWKYAYARLAAQGIPAAKARFIAHRLAWDTPSSTVLDIKCMIHPDQPRAITVREGARLCGYPDWFQFYTDKADPTGKTSEVTQAVIPYVGNYLGRLVMQSLDRAEPLDLDQHDRLRVVDWRPIAKPFFPRRFKETCAATWIE